ncbi:FG-GAP-like repeat-containing protein [Microbulbifer variabilis]|uniref:FG-GAP-like repeat-containing protein n=1 Tax=Microbulbifer variabilis TaxID=266805 RepID=A0ABY4VAC3_9GAMM|nr:RHS repeat-associated core domain-containing protein [Microbulbifer variabilis]USD21229.1 FG-GAP-like repeat-containing protein [Microbulbifer variabilis]
MNYPSAGTAPTAPSTHAASKVAITWSSRVGNAFFLKENQSGRTWEVKGPTTRIEISAPSSDGQYTYSLKSCMVFSEGGGASPEYNCGNYSSASNVMLYRKVPGSAQAPTLSSTQSSNGEVNLTWAKPSGNATYYYLEKEKQNSGSWLRIGTSQTDLSESVKGLTDGEWKFRVLACNGYDWSCNTSSESKELKVRTPPGTPGIPTMSSGGSNVVSWSQPAGAISAYQLRRKVFDGPWELVYSANKTFYPDSDLRTGTWYYQVRACNDFACSAYSASAEIVYDGGASNSSISGPVLATDYTLFWTNLADSVRISERGPGETAYRAYLRLPTQESIGGPIEDRGEGEYQYLLEHCHSDGAIIYGCTGTLGSKVVKRLNARTAAINPEVSTNGQYAVSWDPAPFTIDHYQYRVNAGPWQDINTNSVTVTQSESGRYGYQVRGCISGDCSTAGVTSFVDVILAPAVPRTIEVEAGSSADEISVYWEAGEGNNDEFVLELETADGAWEEQYRGSALTATVAGVSAGRYVFRVKSCNVEPAGRACSGWRTSLTYQHPLLFLSPSISTDGKFSLSWSFGGGTAKVRVVSSQVKNGSNYMCEGAEGGCQVGPFLKPGQISFHLEAAHAQANENSEWVSLPLGGEERVYGRIIYPPVKAIVSLEHGETDYKGYDWDGNYSFQIAENPGDFIEYWEYQESATGDFNSAVTQTLGASFSGKEDGTYYYRVRGCNSYFDCDLSAWSDTVKVQVWHVPLPSAPTIEPLENSTSGNYSVSWRYQVGQYLDAPHGTFVLKENGKVVLGEDGDSSSTTYTVNGKDDGTHSYQVEACNPRACSGYSSAESLHVAHRPGSIESISATPAVIYDGKVEVIWSNPANRVVQFYLEQGSYDVDSGQTAWTNDSISSGQQVDPQVLDQAILSYRGAGNTTAIAGLENGQYKFRVWACNKQGDFEVCNGPTESQPVKVVNNQNPSPLPSGEAPSAINIPSAASSEVVASDLVGETAGQFRVTESGTPSYSIPILTGPASGDVAPKIALSYAGSGGNGPAGVGWGISGLSTIIRCRMTREQDGFDNDLSLGLGDRFCLDGQRLVATSGAYGEAGTEYRTAVDSFTLVTQFGDRNGPDYFEVRRKDGSISYYGVTTDSYLTGVGRNSAVKLMWAQSTFSDSVGNTISYHYQKDVAKGEHLINRIEYASNDGVAASNRIEFHYSDSRADTSSGYWLGTVTSQTKRLATITSYSENKELRTYKLGYIASASTGRSLLESIQECVGANCLAPTTFNWSQPNIGYGDKSEDFTSGNQDLTASFYSPRSADVDGDGHEDLTWVRRNSSGSDYFVSVATAESYLGNYRLNYVDAGDIKLPKNHVDQPMSWHLADYFGTGKLDLIVATDSNWKVHRYSGAGFSSTPIDTGIPAKGTSNSLLQDIDGDGLPDLVRLVAGVPGGDLPKLVIHSMQRDGAGGYRFNPKEKTFPLVFGDSLEKLGDIESGDFWPDISLAGTRLADFNGDGRVDLYARIHWKCTPVGRIDGVCDSTNDTHLWMLLHTEGGSFVETSWGDYEIAYSADPSGSELLPADINGDGLTDYLYKSKAQGNWYANINTGLRFIASNHTIPAGQPIAFTDYDGDGVLDMMAVDTTLSTPKMVRHYWDGDRFEREELFAAPGYDFSPQADRNYAHFFLDLEGDGFASHMQLRYSNSGEHSDIVAYHDSANNLEPTDEITKITHGLGSVTDIHYRRMNLPGASAKHTYIKGTGAAALEFGSGSGIVDLIAPSFLVSRVESTAPIAADTSHQVAVSYKYEAARIQAGGRGHLGFEKVSSIDEQTGVVTTTVYRQDYPFVGMPASTAKCLEPTKLVSCEIDDPSSKLISTAVNTLDSFVPVPGTVLPYVRTATETSFTLNLEKAQKTVTTTTYNSGDDRKFGNISSLQIENYDGLDRLLSRKATQNTYDNNAGLWHLGRLTRTEVTTTKPLTGLPAETRISAFTYDPDSGLLKSETIEPDNPALSVTTAYGYDKFGNKVSATSSAQGEQDRTTKWHYDTAGRYLVAEENALGQVTSFASSFTHYGKAQVVADINGVLAGTAYSDFGKSYFKWVETGAFNKTLAADCAIAGCSNGPAGAAYKITTTTFNSSTTVEYFDKLGRQLRSSRTGFAGRWIFEDKEYDELGHVDRQSLPYFSGDTAAWTKFDYDLLGRTEHTDVPGNQCDITVTYDQLQSDGTARTSTTTSGGSGCNQTKYQDRNVLGELLKVTDNAGNTVTYQYDIQGNLTHTTTVDMEQGANITIQLHYDALGRKDYMVDPDKGRWDYIYTGFGELQRQTDAEGNYQEMHYDALGRMIYREDRKAGGALEKATRWYYDRDPDCSKVSYAAGKLVFVAESSAPIASNCTVDFDQLSYARMLGYDFYARPEETITILGDAGADGDHWQKLEYDSFGRVKLSYDTANEMAAIDASYTKGIWNHYHPQWGYITEVTSPDYIAGSTGQRYYQLQGMDARGNSTQTLLGNGLTVVQNYDPVSNRLQGIDSGLMPGLGNVQKLQFNWLANGNLDYREDYSGEAGAEKALREDFSYDGLNRLTGVSLKSADGSSQVGVGYSTSGNILSKTGVGNYRYGAQCASSYGPHAVCETDNGSVTTSYHYDNNGNLIADSTGRSLRYSVFNKPLSIDKGNHRTQFRYGPGRERWKRIDDANGAVTETLYLGNVEKVYKNGSTEIRRTIAGFVLTTEKYDTDLRQWQADRFAGNREGEHATDYLSTTKNRYLLRDHLGSLDAVTDEAGLVVEQLSFDPWGQRRNAQDWQSALDGDALSNILAITPRGFTGHESLDEVGLIHMNGRIYDPVLGRFVQADPQIDGATNSQGYNRYSYVRNNPMAFTDPTGYWSFRENLPQIMQAAAIAAACIHPAAYGAATAIYAKGSGASTQQALMQGVKAAAISFASAKAYEAIGNYGAANGVGANTAGAVQVGKKVWVSKEVYATMVVAHGLVGGIAEKLQGGKFGHGFVSAALTKGLSPAIGKLPKSMQIFASMMVGGTTSELSGGKFANGAITAAMQYAMNWDGDHEDAQKDTLDRKQIIANHSAVRRKVHGSAVSNPNGSIYLSKLDQEAILAFEFMQALNTDKSLSSYLGDFINADTFIYEDGLATSTFILEGVGPVNGGDFNYISVGMMAAHYGHSLGMVAFQSTMWNSRQLMLGEGLHNYGQMFSGAYWGGYGHEYYKQQQK